jgi:hypothetical protein
MTGNDGLFRIALANPRFPPSPGELIETAVRAISDAGFDGLALP